MGIASFFTSLLTLFLVVVAGPRPASAVISEQSELATDFPLPGNIAEKVWFWEIVFSRYPSTSVLIHDVDHPQLIVDVIDFELFAGRFHKGVPYSRKERDSITSKYVKRYELALSRVRSEGKAATRLGAMEKRVYAVYGGHQAALENASLRSQAGLKDEFGRAALRANQYLPYMERTFKQKGIPVDLTRLAFVESMFNLNAVSKVGASGIWQFMPETARNWLIVNPFFDERNSPTKATRAAANLLAFNYKELGSWPLAITAYNHGTASVAKAVRQLSTRDIGAIVERYKAPSFGFASRNFYAEFIAARNVYNRTHAPNANHSANPLAITSITLPRHTSLRQIIEQTPLSLALLKKYNPCIKSRAFGQHRINLPPNYELLVPNYMASDIERALARINSQARRG